MPRPLPPAAATTAAALFCWFFAVVPAAAQGPSGSPGRDFQDAVNAYRAGSFARAAEEFAAFEAAYPDDDRRERASYFAGFSLREDGQLAKAKDALAAAVREFPNSDLVDDALLRSGLIEAATGDPGAATVTLKDLLRRFPDSELATPALRSLGDAQAAAGDAAGAASAYRQFLRTNPPAAAAATVRRSLGKVLVELGDVEQAAELWEVLAAGTGPAADAALADLGLLRYNAGEYDAAADLFTRLLDRDPPAGTAAEARLNRGYARYQLGRFAEAEEDLAAAAGTDRFAAVANQWAAEAARRDGRPGDAVEYLRDGLSADPPPARAAALRFNLASLAEAGGTEASAAEAADLFERAATEDPRGARADDALLRAAKLRRRLGALKTARSLLDRFEQLYAGSPRAGEARLEAVRLDRAVADTPEVVADRAARNAALTAIEGRFRELSADEALPAAVRRDAAIELGQMLSLRKNFSDAAAEFRGVAEALEPGDDDVALADALFFWSQAAADAGDADAARTAGDRFLTLFPDDPRAGDARARRLEALAAEDPDAALAAYRTQTAAGRTAVTDAAGVALADRAVERMETAGTDDLPRLYETVQTVARPIAADPAADELTRAGARYQLAWADYNTGRFREASEKFAALAAADPDGIYHDDAVAQAAIALDDAGAAEEARGALDAAWEELAPDQPVEAPADAQSEVTPAWTVGSRRAKLLRRLGELPAAAAAYADLHRLFPRTQRPAVLWNWAQVHLDAEAYDEADKLFAQLVAESPGNPNAAPALLYLAESDRFAGDTDAAIAKLRRLIEPASDEPISPTPDEAAAAAEGLAEVYILKSEPARAAAVAAAAAEKFPQSPSADRLRLLEAAALAGDGRAEEAREALAALRSDLGPRFRNDRGRPDWAAEPWIVGAELALAAKEHAEVDALVAELEAWDPPAAGLVRAQAVLARSLYQRPVPDFAAAEEQTERLLNDPAVTGQTMDDLYALHTDLATQQTPPNYAAAERRASRMRFQSSTDTAKAAGGVQLGRIFEAMGSPDRAAIAYRSVLDELPDAPAAADARARLDALGGGE